MEMSPGVTYLVIWIGLNSACCIEAWGGFDAITSWVSDISYSVVDHLDATRCKYFECCHKRWSFNDFHVLDRKLRTEVYGQNIMIDIVVPALKGHLGSSRPQGGGKALAMSFHGRPGVGKNYVTKYIQDVLFQGSDSKYVHFYTGRIHFPLESETMIYQKNLIDWIRGNVTKCVYSVFIFDEVDKMPPKVLDVIKPYLDYHELIDNIDFRKTTFIFLSNTGGDLIAKQYLKYWKSGKKREQLQLKDFEDLIRLGAFNEKGGFYKSETIESSLIDHYIPFLPLEEQHIRSCILDEFRKRHIHDPRDVLIKRVIEQLTFGGPDDTPIFSNSGCKRISPKVAALVEAIRDGRIPRDEL